MKRIVLFLALFTLGTWACSQSTTGPELPSDNSFDFQPGQGLVTLGLTPLIPLDSIHMTMSGSDSTETCEPTDPEEECEPGDGGHVGGGN